MDPRNTPLNPDHPAGPIIDAGWEEEPGPADPTADQDPEEVLYLGDLDFDEPEPEPAPNPETLVVPPAESNRPDDRQQPTAATPPSPTSGRNSNGFACGFPAWLKWFIPLAAAILAGLIIWSALNRPQAVIDTDAITEAVDKSEVAARVDGLERMLAGDNDSPGITERLGNNGLGGQITQVNNTVNELVTVVNNLNVTVNDQGSQIADLKKSVDKGNETLDKLANQLLAEGNSLCWSSAQFGWAKTSLTPEAEKDFVDNVLPKIKTAAEANPTMVIRVVGRVDRSSTKTANDGQVAVGKGRATYIAGLLKEAGVKVEKTTWAYSYTPNRRVGDVYVEPPK
ncbi:MAG: hypothetical protein WC323_00390 [Patescibacteria group bacterium]|jgi:outer membrane protein OmpA-like peptidoglycan-associated protein